VTSGRCRRSRSWTAEAKSRAVALSWRVASRTVSPAVTRILISVLLSRWLAFLRCPDLSRPGRRRACPVWRRIRRRPGRHGPVPGTPRAGLPNVDNMEVTAPQAPPAVPARRLWRTSAILIWLTAAGFGPPTVPVAVYVLEWHQLPWFFDLFPMYGGPVDAWVGTQDRPGRCAQPGAGWTDHQPRPTCPATHLNRPLTSSEGVTSQFLGFRLNTH
jgi:hypothetical protein